MHLTLEHCKGFIGPEYYREYAISFAHCAVIGSFLDDDFPEGGITSGQRDCWYVPRRDAGGNIIELDLLDDDRIHGEGSGEMYPVLYIQHVLSKPFLTALGEKLRWKQEKFYQYTPVHSHIGETMPEWQWHGRWLLNIWYTSGTEAVGAEICKWINEGK
jgi:hypothetical protein